MANEQIEKLLRGMNQYDDRGSNLLESSISAASSPTYRSRGYLRDDIEDEYTNESIHHSFANRYELFNKVMMDPLNTDLSPKDANEDNPRQKLLTAVNLDEPSFSDRVRAMSER